MLKEQFVSMWRELLIDMKIEEPNAAVFAKPIVRWFEHENWTEGKLPTPSVTLMTGLGNFFEESHATFFDSPKRSKTAAAFTASYLPNPIKAVGLTAG